MIHLLVLILRQVLESAQSVSASVCIRRAPAVSVTRTTAGTRLAVVAASVSPVWPVAAVTAVNAVQYSSYKQDHSSFLCTDMRLSV